MIQLRSILVPADNSGAKRLMVIHIHGGSKRYTASLGEVVTCVVDQAEAAAAVKDSEIVRAVIVRVRRKKRRKDGTYIGFDDNAGVLIDKDGNPRGTRIFGPVAREVKEKGWGKIASKAKEIV